MYTQKIANIFDHLQDHSRLGLESKFLETNHAEFFCVRQVYFTNSCQQIWGCLNQPFIIFIHHIWGETTVYHTDLGQNAVFHNFSRQIALSQYSGWSIVGFKRNRSKFPKSPIRPADSRFYSASCQCGWVFEWTLIELCFNIMANLLFFLLFNGFSYNDVFDTRDITKGTDKRLKLQERLLTIKKRNIIRWNIYRHNNLHSRRQALKCL